MPALLPTATLIQVAASVTSAVPTCTTAVPDGNGFVPPDSCNANYGFYPRWEDNLAFALGFGVTTVVHLAQAVVFKKASQYIHLYT
jgi:hypothetical protein